MEIDCPLEDNPVCGSDGRRYRNPCVMEARACQMRKDVTIVEFGDKCGTKKILPKVLLSMPCFETSHFLLRSLFFVFVFVFCFLLRKQ